MDLFSSAIQLGIGGLAVAGVIYVSLQHAKTVQTLQTYFLKAIDERADKHEKSMSEREIALRNVEVTVRNSLTEQLTKNTVILLDVAKLLSKVARHLDEK